MNRLREALKQNTRTVDKATFAELEKPHLGFDPGYAKHPEKPGDYFQRDPKAAAGHVPKPRRLKETVGPASWEDYLTEDNFNQDWVILGGGESQFKYAKELDGKLVYGINWTMLWFPPTFLQLIDAPVYHDQVEGKPYRKHEEDVQLVTSKWLAKTRMSKEYADESLQFDLIHPGSEKRAAICKISESPSEEMMWGPNSIIPALQVLYWFKPRRVALVGFDWGGPHTFGDGRSRGAQCNYGKEGTFKEGLVDKIKYQKEQLEERGMVIRHVGENKLNVFQQVESIEEAFK